MSKTSQFHRAEIWASGGPWRAPSDALGKNLILASSTSGGSWHSVGCGHITLVSASVRLHMAFSMCVKSWTLL